jgi:hypothetical protein
MGFMYRALGGKMYVPYGGEGGTRPGTTMYPPP